LDPFCERNRRFFIIFCEAKNYKKDSNPLARCNQKIINKAKKNQKIKLKLFFFAIFIIFVQSKFAESANPLCNFFIAVGDKKITKRKKIYGPIEDWTHSANVSKKIKTIGAKGIFFNFCEIFL